MIAAASVLAPATAAGQALVDTHIHYSHDAWEQFPPDEALRILRAAGLEKAFVSSSSDEGTQKLYALAPQFIVPVLRPYRKRGELTTWMHDETVVAMLERLLAANPYAGIGEFHVFGEDADLPVVRKVVELAGRYGIFLHAHSDADAIDRLFAQDPDARILWAHSGFVGPVAVRRMLEKHDNLLADLAFRGEFAQGDRINSSWRKLFLDFPDRFMIGTDTYTPERWYAVEDNAAFTRQWLADLPDGAAARIGRGNAAALAGTSLANWAAAQETAGCSVSGGDGAIILEGAKHTASVEPDPQEIGIGPVFAADIIVCAEDGTPFEGEVFINATMPAHGHGMNTAAAVTKLGPGRFRAEGLMFHMPGQWQIEIQLSGGDGDDTMQAGLTVD
jgi:hypothetical protein